MSDYTGLTPTVVLRYINRMLGSTVQLIELSEDEIMRVVFQESLYTYSKFFPYVIRVPMSMNDMIDRRSLVFRIPNIDRLELLGIHKVFPGSSINVNSGVFPVYQNPIDSQISKDMLSMTQTPFTWEFEQPDTLTLFPKITNTTHVTAFIKTVHPRHLKTIGLDMREHFLKLCLLDVLLSLYPIRHRFENITTPYGSIQPFLDMVDTAKEEKNDLLETFRLNHLNDSSSKRIIIA